MKVGSSSFTRSQTGVAYLWMLFAVFLIGLGVGKTLELIAQAAQREKEAELLHVGRLYREAIRDYYQSSPGSRRQYPEKLDDLLRDPRHLTTRRYIRRLYPDPMNGLMFQPVFSPTGGIQGVRSASTGVPLKRSGFLSGFEAFEVAASYQEWKFVYSEN